jgi:hypothetical protein
MTWQAIAEGAKGIVFYSFHGMFKFADEATRAKLWSDVVAVAREVKRFEDVLLSVESAPEAVGAPPGLSTRTWRRGGEVYLLAVNTTREPLSAEIEVRSARRIRVELPPIGVSMTKISE